MPASFSTSVASLAFNIGSTVYVKGMPKAKYCWFVWYWLGLVSGAFAYVSVRVNVPFSSDTEAPGLLMLVPSAFT